MSNKFKIEKNVEMPNTPGTKGTSKYPFEELEVGDSFQIDEVLRNTVCSAATRFGKDNNKKFSIRRYGDGFRVWRIK